MALEGNMVHQIKPQMLKRSHERLGCLVGRLGICLLERLFEHFGAATLCCKCLPEPFQLSSLTLGLTLATEHVIIVHV